jgi:hypothetical protein
MLIQSLRLRLEGHVARGGYRLAVSTAIVALISSAALAQEIPAPPAKPNPVPGTAVPPSLFNFFSAKTPYEFWLTCVILVAGLVFAYLAVSFLRQIHREELEHATRAMTILFVIIATMVLITAGYNNEQIAPAFGLFGTIVGYILGRGQKVGEVPPAGSGNGGTPIGPRPPKERTASARPAPAAKSPASANTEKE